MAERIYLDNAATSFPKPESVYAAADRFQREVGSAAGRSATRAASVVQQTIDRCRQRLARLLNAGDPRQIIFTLNATDSLNLAIHGLLRPGDHAVTSTIEHNSVLRPLRTLAEAGVELTHVPADREGYVHPEAFREALRPNTRLVALTHASNVSGALQPIDEVGAIAREAGAVFLVDAAQTTGHLPIDVAKSPIDILACAGHKGLLGPLGTGVLYVRREIADRLRSLQQGGTGTMSEQDRQPAEPPEKFESGNLNVPGLFGLEAGLAWIEEQGLETLAAHGHEATARLLKGLAAMPAIRVYGPAADRPRVGVVSIAAEGFEPQELAAILDDSFSIDTRAGLHCAPGAHRALGTFEHGGTVRLSPGPFTTPEQIDRTLESLAAITGG